MTAAREIMFLTLLILFIAKGTSGTGDVTSPVCNGTLVQVECSSWQYKYKACPVGDGTTVIDFAVVAEKQSVSACKYYDGNYLDYNGINGDYGYTENILWVDNGCRAKFNVCLVSGCPGTLTRVNCSSWQYQYAECVVPGTIVYATVYDKQSVSSCNSTGNSPSPPNYPQDPETTGIYGYRYDTLWVNSGCRAEFEVCYLETCIIRGDPHITTADNETYVYGGAGAFSLIIEETSTYIITAVFIPCRRNHPYVSCLFILIIKIKITIEIETEAEIKLVRGGSVFVDGNLADLPYESDNGKFRIFELDAVIKFELPEELSILWDKKKRTVLNLPFFFLGKITGLCGTYDFNKRNDFMLPNGTVVDNTIIFGDSWKV